LTAADAYKDETNAQSERLSWVPAPIFEAMIGRDVLARDAGGEGRRGWSSPRSSGREKTY
jgi:hypothetical protein